MVIKCVESLRCQGHELRPARYLLTNRLTTKAQSRETTVSQTSHSIPARGYSTYIRPQSEPSFRGSARGAKKMGQDASLTRRGDTLRKATDVQRKFHGLPTASEAKYVFAGALRSETPD